MVFIGQLGGDAIAGVAFNMPIFLMLGLTMGIGSGVTASIARYIGEKNKANADNSANHAILIAAVDIIHFTVAGILYGKDILIILGAEEEILFLGFEYLLQLFLDFHLWFFQVFLGLYLQEKEI